MSTASHVLSEKLHKGSMVLKSCHKSFRSTNDWQRAPGNCETPVGRECLVRPRRAKLEEAHCAPTERE